MQAGLKTKQQAAQGIPGSIDFRVGFRNKKKDSFSGFYTRSKINYCTFYFLIAMIATLYVHALHYGAGMQGGSASGLPVPGIRRLCMIAP
jgi:hypothetical protein